MNSPHGAETEPGALPHPDRKGLGYGTCTTEGAHLSGSDANLRRLGWLPTGRAGACRHEHSVYRQSLATA